MIPIIVIFLMSCGHITIDKQNQTIKFDIKDDVCFTQIVEEYDNLKNKSEVQEKKINPIENREIEKNQNKFGGLK